MKGSAIYCWEVASGKKLPQPQEPEDFISSVAFTPDGKSLMSVGHLGMVYFWDVQSNQRRLTFSKGEHASYYWNCAVTLSPDGKVVATIGRDSSKPKMQRECLFLRDAATGRILQRLDDPKDEGEPGTCVFSPDGRFLACPWHSKANSYEVLLWEVATRKRLPQRFSGWAPAFSSDSTLLASQNVEKGGYVFNIFEITTGKKLCTRAEEFSFRYGFSSPVCFSYVSFSPDDRALLALVFNQHNSSIIKLKQYPLYRIKPSGISVGKPRIIASHEDKFSLGYGSNQPIMGGLRVGALAVSPDGKLLASVNDEGHIIHVWETATGKERCRFQGHNDQIHYLAFSPDGRRLASCSDDTTVLVWDITGRLKDKERLASIRLSAKQMKELWTDLTATDAKQANKAIWRLVAGGQPTVAFLAKQLQPVPVSITPKALDQLIADLENNRYAARQKARRQLESLGELAEPSLHQALEKQPSLELRRSVDHLITLIEEQRANPSAETLRLLRAIEVLEQIGTTEARKLFGYLASCIPGIRQTEEAKASVDRLTRRASQQ